MHNYVIDSFLLMVYPLHTVGHKIAHPVTTRLHQQKLKILHKLINWIKAKDINDNNPIKIASHLKSWKENIETTSQISVGQPGMHSHFPFPSLQQKETILSHGYKKGLRRFFANKPVTE